MVIQAISFKINWLSPINRELEKAHTLAVKKRSTDKMGNKFVETKEYSTTYKQWFQRPTTEGKVRLTKVSLQLLMLNVFGDAGRKHFSSLDKQELIIILGNIYRNRRNLFQIIWDFYLSFPILNIAVLLLLLLVLIDFFTALLTTMLYFILTVCTAIGFGLWEEKKYRNSGRK